MAPAPAGEAACPLWLRFLDKTFGTDAALIGFLQRWLGYALTGSVAEHGLVYGWGSGSNGKSVFLNTILLRAAGPAILRWMIDGCLAWQADGLRGATAVDDATHNYIFDEDWLGLFLVACRICNPEERTTFTPIALLFAAWRDWAAKVGIEPGTQRAFATALTVRLPARALDLRARVSRPHPARHPPSMTQ